MRINNQLIPGIHKAYDQQKKSVAINESGQASKKDDIELSAEAKLWVLATKALRDLPESNTDVAELKQAVTTGTYQVNSEEVAEKIWQESGFDKKI